MDVGRLPRALVLVGLLSLSTVISAALPVARTDDATALVSIRLGCSSNPETVTIQNKQNVPSWLASVGSSYDPHAGEPY